MHATVRFTCFDAIARRQLSFDYWPGALLIFTTTLCWLMGGDAEVKVGISSNIFFFVVLECEP